MRSGGARGATGSAPAPEMDNAINFGYEFKIISGYQFSKGNIFELFIKKMLGGRRSPSLLRLRLRPPLL
jgi:hypothetical protein